MSDDEDLMVGRHLFEPVGDLEGHLPTDSRVDLIENQGWDLIHLGQNALQGQHHPGQLSSGGYPREGARIKTRVQSDKELHPLPPPLHLALQG